VKLDWTGSTDEFDALLTRWRGARAEAWHYHVSHGVFYLALHRSPAVAYLQFKDCQSIHLYRTVWEPADLCVSRVPHRLGTLHTIVDPGNFHLVCWAAFGAESPRRVSLPELTGDA
jgi:hypothetical protein